MQRAKKEAEVNMEGAQIKLFFSAQSCTFYTMLVLIHGYISSKNAHACGFYGQVSGLQGPYLGPLLMGTIAVFSQFTDKAKHIQGEAADSCHHRTVGRVRGGGTFPHKLPSPRDFRMFREL